VGQILFGGHFEWWQEDFSPVLSPGGLVGGECRVGEVPNGVLACGVVSHH